MCRTGRPSPQQTLMNSPCTIRSCRPRRTYSLNFSLPPPLILAISHRCFPSISPWPLTLFFSTSLICTHPLPNRHSLPKYPFRHLEGSSAKGTIFWCRITMVKNALFYTIVTLPHHLSSSYYLFTLSFVDPRTQPYFSGRDKLLPRGTSSSVVHVLVFFTFLVPTFIYFYFYFSENQTRFSY